MLHSVHIWIAVILLTGAASRGFSQETLSAKERAEIQHRSLDLDRETLDKEFEVLKDHLTEAEREKLGNATLKPRITGRPFEFFARHVGGSPTITISEPGLRSVTSLAFCLAMTEQIGDPSFFVNYMLYVRAHIWTAKFIVSPMEAAGWECDDLSDAAIRKYAMIRTQMETAIIAHEMAHIIFKHAPLPEDRQPTLAELKQSRLDEAEADRFACKLLKRMKGAPSGMILTSMSAMLIFDRGQPIEQADHPAWNDRLRAAAKFAVENMDSFDWEVTDPYNNITYKTDPAEARKTFEGAITAADTYESRASLRSLDDDAAKVTLKSLRRRKP